MRDQQPAANRCGNRPFQRSFAAAKVWCFGVVVLQFGLFAAAAEPDRDVLAKIPARMQQFVDRHEIAGAVLVVGRHDGVLSLDAVGQRDIDAHAPMAKDAMFRIASMTKPVTAMGIMILVDEGKLSIEDEVEKYLPEFRGQMLLASKTPESTVLKKPSRKITIRDLLTHTSGMPSMLPEGLSDLYRKRNHTLAETVMAVSQRPLEFEPGSRWQYCNLGIDTLGRIIEVVSGQRYEDFLKKRIFEPLGMNDTTFYPDAGQLARLATLYEAKDGRLTSVPRAIIELPSDARYPIPAGGLCSTGGDLAKLYQMMLFRGEFNGKRILSEKSVGAMTSLQTGELATGFVPGMGWGLGVAIVRQPKGTTAMMSPGTFGHGGAFGTQAWLDPKQDLFVVLLIQRSNLPNADDSEIRKELQRLAVEAIQGGK